MRLGLQLYSAPRGALLADWSDTAQDVVVRTGEHGYLSMDFFVPMSTPAAFGYYNRGDVPYVKLSEGGAAVWEGRVEDFAIEADGLRVGAYGYWNAYHDVLYTALWSKTGSGEFVAMQQWTGSSPYAPEKWEQDNNNRLYLAPRKDEQFDNATAMGGWGYSTPDGGDRAITRITFDYELKASSSWYARLRQGDSSWGVSSATGEWSLQGNGATQTGSASVNWAAAPNTRPVFYMYYNSGTLTTYTGETGATYVKFTNVRITTGDSGTSSTITADQIAAAMIDFVNAINGDAQVRPDYTLIENPGIDLDSVLYADATPGDILSDLASIGDDSTPPLRYEVGVWDEQRLHFRPRHSANNVWRADVVALEIDRSLSQLLNAVYATYNDDQRTAVAYNQDSAERVGLIRYGTVSASTSSETTAETYRDALLTDAGDGQPRAQIFLSGVYNDRGTQFPFWYIRAGDSVTLRNLPPDLGDLNWVRNFRVKQTEYNASNDTLTITPEELPTLEFLVARSNIR